MTKYLQRDLTWRAVVIGYHEILGTRANEYFLKLNGAALVPPARRTSRHPRTQPVNSQRLLRNQSADDDLGAWYRRSVASKLGTVLKDSSED